MNGTRDGQLFDQTRTACATSGCAGEASVMLASPTGAINVVCPGCATTLIDPPGPRAPKQQPPAARGLRVNLMGCAAWLTLVCGLVLFAFDGWDTLALYLSVFGVLFVSGAVDRASLRRSDRASLRSARQG